MSQQPEPLSPEERDRLLAERVADRIEAQLLIPLQAERDSLAARVSSLEVELDLLRQSVNRRDAFLGAAEDKIASLESRLSRAREALAEWERPGPSLCQPGGHEAAERAARGLHALRAALTEDAPTRE